MNYIDIIDLVTENHWRITGTSHYMSHHMYRNSPIETDTDCDNCDGANCDGCKKVIVPAHLKCSIPVDELKNMLIHKGVPEDIASDIAHSDFYSPYQTGYYLFLPTANMLKEHRPELYNTLTTLDLCVIEVFDEIIRTPECTSYSILLDTIVKRFNVSEYDYYNRCGHIMKQWELWSSMYENVFKDKEKYFVMRYGK